MKLSLPLTTIAGLLSFKVCLGRAKEDPISHNSLSEDSYPTPDDNEQNYFDVLLDEETVYVTLEPPTVYITVTKTIIQQETKSPEVKTLTFFTTKLTTYVETETEIKKFPIFEGTHSVPNGASDIAINLTTNTANNATVTATKDSQSDTPGELNLVFGTESSKGSYYDTPTGTGLLNKDLTKSEYTVVSSTIDIVGSSHVISSTLEISSKYFEHVLTNGSSSEQTKNTPTLIQKTSSFREEVLRYTKNESGVIMNSTLSNTQDIDTKYNILEGFSPYSDLPTADFDLSNTGSSNFNLKIGTIILGAATIFFVVGTIVL